MTTRSKRWLSFSLRSSLVVLTLIGIALGVVANRANRQLKTLAAIKSVGGHYRLHRDAHGFGSKLMDRLFGEEAFAKITMVSLSGTDASDELVIRIAGFHGLSDLDLSSTKTTDAGVSAISTLPLRVLLLQECPITDESGKHLAKSSSLQRLLVNGSDCTDRFIQNIGSLPELRDLGLRGTKVTSEGMHQIGFFPKLEKLYLYRTAIDDIGIKLLENNGTITKLDLSMTNVTDDSFETFRTLPSLKELDLNACHGVTRAAAKKFATESKCAVDCNSRD